MDAVPWYEQLSMFHFPHYYTVDFDGAGIETSVGGADAALVLVEFYAPWCPHCQHFAPEYERLALAIKRHNEKSPTEAKLMAATVDCVRHQSTCEHWNINGFPTLLWGTKDDWANHAVSNLREVMINEPTAEAVAEWIAGATQIQLETESISREEVVSLAGSGGGDTLRMSAVAAPALPAPDKVDHWDIQVSTALFLHNAFELADEFEEHQLLSDFVGLLARRYPEHPAGGNGNVSCRQSFQFLQHKLAKITDSSEDGQAFTKPSPDDMESGWKLCGTDWSEYPKHGWRSCRATFPGKRGFTCGLWSLFHAVIAESDDANAGKDLGLLRSAISNFFDCNACRKHFDSLVVDPKDLESKSAVQLWWWRTHNNVNARVKAFEDKYNDGDPAFPKVQWPTTSQCPRCRRPSATSFLSLRRNATTAINEAAWNFDEVTSFLSRYYGSA